MQYLKVVSLSLFCSYILCISNLAGREDWEGMELFENYCFDCHDEDTQKGNVNMTKLFDQGSFDGALMFENLITHKMPPENKSQPNSEETEKMLKWLTKKHIRSEPDGFRRISRHEFNHSLNDLLHIQYDVSSEIPDDRGTYDYDSDRRIKLTKEMLGSYFSTADQMLEFSLPADGFPEERIWVTNKIKDSHKTYNIYTRPYKQGILFSWTRANNGNSYSFFYDNFDPPVEGWYDLTFDAMKLGEFQEDISLMVFAGKYYYADDRPQPQHLLDVISVGNRKELESYKVRVFLRPGENVSVHCYSKHTFRKKKGNQGIYIKQLEVRGPIVEEWPPRSYQKLFKGLPIRAEERVAREVSSTESNLEKIGGSVSVSSFQNGMEKEKMLDGSNRTFWHSRFKPTLAEPPHYVILENPNGRVIDGLSYATWSGGNGNGQIQAYSVFLSDDGQNWGEPIIDGNLEIRLANEQFIDFPQSTNKKYIKFLVTKAHSLDGRSLASIGRLDVLTDLSIEQRTAKIFVDSKSEEDLKVVLQRFAEKAFASRLTNEDLQPYFQPSLDMLNDGESFVEAAKVGFKAVLCSPRFLMAPGEHANLSYSKAADLARIFWLSVPDEKLVDFARANNITSNSLPQIIDHMIEDPRSSRMIHSLCQQWLELRTFDQVAPSLKLYPTYNTLLNHYLPIETETYLGYLIKNNLPVDYLIDSNFSILNQRLAQHYGIDGVIGQEMRKVSFSPEVPRGGLLTMGSILKVTADGFDTSPILRGAWISKNIAGNTLSPPPESVEAVEPEHGEDAASLREQIEEHKKNQACYACHKSIDPYGFALESFDATGQWRDQYRVKTPHKNTFTYRRNGYFKLTADVDPSGSIGKEDFTDVFGFKKILRKDHKKIAYNLIKKFFEYANGYQPDLRQRFDLYSMIPHDPKKCRIRDLLIHTLDYSLIK